MDLPRILHVDSGRSWRGGQRQVFLLATGLRDMGYRTLVVAPAGSPLIRRAERAGLPTYRLTLRGEWDLRSARELRAVATEWKADIVHAHDARSHSIGRIALLGKRKTRLRSSGRIDDTSSSSGMSEKPIAMAATMAARKSLPSCTWSGSSE